MGNGIELSGGLFNVQRIHQRGSESDEDDEDDPRVIMSCYFLR